MTSGPTPRPGILDLAPYVGGAAGAGDGAPAINIASNESPLGASPQAVAAYEAAGADLAIYPDGGCDVLRAALAAHHGLEADRIVCGAGSDELIALLCKAYAGTGDEVLHSAHGFLMYALSAKGAGATPVAVPERDLTTDVGAVLARVNARTKIVFLANPNNPTGSYLAQDDVARLHAGLPADVLLVLDAAYAEYVTRNDYKPGTALARAHDNVVMTRTFSKIYGLAALRVGWMYGPPDVVDVVNRVRGPFNVSGPAQAAAVAALADIAHTDQARLNNDAVMPWFIARCEELGLTVNPSAGNFVLVRFDDKPGRDAAAAFIHLRDRGVLVRRMGGYGLPAWLRMTIGTQAQMQETADGLRELLGAA